MALLKPEINRALEAAGLAPVAAQPDDSLSQKLSAAGMGLETTLEELALLYRQTESEHLRHSALKTILELHGALKNNTTPTESRTINIIVQTGDKNVDFSFLKPSAFAEPEPKKLTN